MRLVFYILGLFLIVSSCNSEEKVEKNSNWSFSTFKNQIQDGDVILKMGYGQISKIISKQLSEDVPLSHCAIVYKKLDSMFLLHSVSGSISAKDGVQKATLEEFYKDIKPNCLFVLRHKSPDSLRSKISEVAHKIYRQKVPFDMDFDKCTSDKMYCSEFVEESLKKVYNEPFFKTKKIGNNHVYTFNSLLESEKFNQVK